MHILPNDVDPSKCALAATIIWLLGFTSVLCWSILQVPDGGGHAAWVPDVFCRETCLVPLRPFIFALPSFFWPLTLVFLTAKSAETYCGVPLARRVRRSRRSSRRSGGKRSKKHESHDVEEAYTLLRREDDGYCYDERGEGIQMSDLSDLSSDMSDSPRSSYERTPPSPPTAMMEVPVFATQSLFRPIPYQPTAPASMHGN